MKEETKVIRLSLSNYTRLSLLKRGYSFNDYVGVMLNYFGVTNIAPESCQTHPAIESKKDIDRVIRILKSQEKITLKYFDKFEEILERLDGENGVVFEAQREGVDVDTLTDEELGEYVKMKEALEDDNVKLRREVEKLNIEKDKLTLELRGKSGGMNAEVIRQCVDGLRASAQRIRTAEDHLQMPKSDFEAYLKRIEECL